MTNGPLLLLELVKNGPKNVKFADVSIFLNPKYLKSIMAYSNNYLGEILPILITVAYIAIILQLLFEKKLFSLILLVFEISGLQNTT